MGLLDIVSGVLAGREGQGGLGDLLGQGTQGGQADLLKLVLGMLASDGQGGGLAGLVRNFQQAGLSEQVNSWVGGGQNLPVSAEQLSQVFGTDRMSEMADRMGLSTGDLSAQLSQLLPQAVDRFTPQGQMPDGGLGGLEDLLNQLTRR